MSRRLEFDVVDGLEVGDQRIRHFLVFTMEVLACHSLLVVAIIAVHAHGSIDCTKDLWRRIKHIELLLFFRIVGETSWTLIEIILFFLFVFLYA